MTRAYETWDIINITINYLITVIFYDIAAAITIVLLTQSNDE